MLLSCIAAVLAANLPAKVQAAYSASSGSAILMEQSTGRILYEKDAYTKKRIASITKIMTAILAIESGKLDTKAKVSEKAVRAEGSSIYLQPGEKILLEDLVYGLMLRSGNDSAVAIAEHVGGSLEGFVYLMNKKAEEIGMINTHFANPHGLDDHEDHYSTAYDMAVLTRYAMNNEIYRKIAGTKMHRAPNPNESWDRVWKNKNRLLTEMYEYCTGGKTGYTKRAKRTLVTTASKDGLDLIAVTLNGPDDWNDHIGMYESGFKEYSLKKVIEQGGVRELEDSPYEKKAYLKTDYSYPASEEEKDLFRVEYKMLKPSGSWKEDKDFPDVVGRAIVYFENKQVKSLPIYYEKEPQKEEKSFFDFFKSIFLTMAGVKTDG
ncbi:D-alanyl-D-alanine carboxypeptidase [Bacillus infantis]|uniref:D-alanyl-D-alanine carboxypeptidase n=2 Tax=Bacillus infantis TaxID=324767 RepID=A0A5D4RJC5_9BACI|nr:D-alanyl-D-alanine carboxypeptidase [Bacillus infantis]